MKQVAALSHFDFDASDLMAFAMQSYVFAAALRNNMGREEVAFGGIRIHSGFTWNFVNASLVVPDHNCPCSETWLAAFFN